MKSFAQFVTENYSSAISKAKSLSAGYKYGKVKVSNDENMMNVRFPLVKPAPRSYAPVGGVIPGERESEAEARNIASKIIHAIKNEDSEITIDGDHLNLFLVIA